MFLGYKFFDWEILRDKLTLEETKILMMQINYESIDNNRLNYILNKLCELHIKSGQIDFIKNTALTDSGMILIYEWIKVQIKIRFKLFYAFSIAFPKSQNLVNLFLLLWVQFKGGVRLRLNNRLLRP